MDTVAYAAVDKAIDAANTGLERISLVRQNRKLYLRGTLPKKPGEGNGAKRRFISLGIPANPKGVKAARAKAQKLESDLILDKFTWDDWDKRGSLGAKTAQDWAEEFTQVKSGTIKASSFRKDYKPALSRLPAEPLTEDLLRQVTLKWTPLNTEKASNKKARNQYVMVYQQLARFARLECDLKPLRVKYEPAAIEAHTLPTDDEIIEIWEGIEYEPYRWVYGMLATYGLRPHEVFQIEDYDAIASDTGAISIKQNTKTGRREVWTCPDKWRHEFDLKNVSLPKIKNLEKLDNQEIGGKLCQQFRRIKIPHKPYALRHAYAIRTALKGIPDTVAARWMGHSASLHMSVYHSGISRDQHRAVWEQSQDSH